MRRAVVAIVLCGSVSAASAQEAQRPAFEPGDSFRYCIFDYKTDAERSCFTLTFRERRVEAGAPILVFRSTPDTGEAIDVLFTEDMQHRVRGSQRFDPHNAAYKFPFTVGSSWQGQYDLVPAEGLRSNRTRFAKVTGYQDVTVPAGTFKAFKIEYENWLNRARVVPGAKPDDEVVYWCPEIGYYCVYESQAFGMVRHRLVDVKRAKGK